MTIKWPARSSTTQRRNPNFISPSAQSVVVGLDSTILGILNAPPPGQTTSSLTVTVPIGTQTLSMRTYDQANGQGTLLGAVSGEAVISPGNANVIVMTVIGIARSATMQLVANQPSVLGDATTGYTMLGNWGAYFSVTLKDPDGNIILTDPPPISTQGATHIEALWSSTPGELLFLGTSESAGYESVTVVLNNPDGTTLSLPSVKIAASSAVAVADPGGPTIRLYDGNGAAVTLPAGSFPGLSNPTALAYDYCSRIIAAADSGKNNLLFFGLNGQAYPYAVGPFTGLSQPVGITLDPWLESSLGVASFDTINAGDNSLRSYAITGQAFAPTFLGTSFKPTAVACSPLGCPQVVVTSATANAVEMTSASGIVTGKFPGVNQPSAVLVSNAVTPDIYIANRGNNTITVYDGNGNPVTTSGSFPNLSQPVAMAAFRNEILVVNAGNETVTAYDLQGNQQTLPPGAFSGLVSASAILGIGVAQCYG